MKLGRNIIELESVSSTNLYLADLTVWQDVEEGTVVRTGYQTEGRGHGEAHWESEAGRNLLFSVLLRPAFLPVTNQFCLSKAISLALRDMLAEFCSDVRIKWPNDLYIRDMKIAGILIENSIEGTLIKDSIAGIGLNVNQVSFPEGLPNPTSLQLEIGKDIELSLVFNRLISRLNERYAQLQEQQFETIDKEYLLYLYKYMAETTFTESGGTGKSRSSFQARITGVMDSGEIVLQTIQGQSRAFSFKEIEYS